MELYTDENATYLRRADSVGIQNGQDAYLASGTFNKRQQPVGVPNLDTKDAVNVNGKKHPSARNTPFLQHGPDLLRVVRVSTTATRRHLGMKLTTPTIHSHAASRGIASNNFIIQTTTSPVERQARRSSFPGTDVNSWYAGTGDAFPSSTAPCPKDKPTSVSCA